MRAVVQRADRAQVFVEGHRVASIGRGLVVFLGIGKGDGETEIDYLVDKILDLRILPDERHSMQRSLRDEGGQVLLVSQFTVYGDCRKGRRPSFDGAEEPVRAEEVYRRVAEVLSERGFPPELGVFRAHMKVEVLGDGPVTLLLDSARAF